MSNFIRRLVSGPKARFKDDTLNLELDLVYVTDRLIIMGYPAAGFESVYRNRRQDAKRFLDHRHGKNYWVFNLCPIRENSYEKSVFEGRVTRFPFPDHHAPPLALLPLGAREIQAWLDASPAHVAVIHCKAGKGRSGTMACSYLLSVSAPLSSQATSSPSSKKTTAESLTNEAIDQIPPDTHPSLEKLQDEEGVARGYNDDPGLPYPPGSALPKTRSPSQPVNPGVNTERSFVDALKGVLDLHTATRMKLVSPPPSGAVSKTSSPGPGDPGVTPNRTKVKKQRQGVSIPSQRRWLYYWAMVLEGGAPENIFQGSLSDALGNKGPPSLLATASNRFIRITEITIRMREPGGVKHGIVHAANIVLDKAVGFREKRKGKAKDAKKVDHKTSEDEDDDSSSSSSDSDDENTKPAAPFTLGANKLWASVARYDDRLVEFLDRWEAHTRVGPSESPPKQKGTQPGESDLKKIDNELSEFRFDEEGTWDKQKMVRNFARFGVVSWETVIPEQKEKDKDNAGEEEEVREKVLEYTLKLASDKRARVQVEVATGNILNEGTDEDGSGGDPAALVEEPPVISIEGAEDVKGEDSEGGAEGGLPRKSDVSSIASSALASTIGQEESHATDGSHKKSRDEVGERGLVVEASRELRIKLYIGKVFIGWMWLIPSFHMTQPAPDENTPIGSPNLKTTLNLTRQDVDFALGLGSAIIHVDINMEWVIPSPAGTTTGATAIVTAPGPVRVDGTSNSLDIAESGLQNGTMGAKLVQAMNAVVHGEGAGLREAVEVGQVTGV